MNIYVIIGLFFFNILFRYNIGTAHSNRFQTKYKVCRFPKTLNLILFFSLSKAPVAYHSIIVYVFSLVLFIFNIIKLISLLKMLQLYLLIIIIVFVPLFIETVHMTYIFRGEWQSESDKSYIIYNENKYFLVVDNKLTEGYLDFVFRNRFVFYNEDDKAILNGTYSIYNNTLILKWDNLEQVTVLRPVELNIKE